MPIRSAADFSVCSMASHSDGPSRFCQRCVFLQVLCLGAVRSATICFLSPIGSFSSRCRQRVEVPDARPIPPCGGCEEIGFLHNYVLSIFLILKNPGFLEERFWLMRRNMWSSLRRIWSGGGVAYLAKAIGNTLHTVGPMSRGFFTTSAAHNRSGRGYGLASARRPSRWRWLRRTAPGWSRRPCECHAEPLGPARAGSSWPARVGGLRPVVLGTRPSASRSSSNRLWPANAGCAPPAQTGLRRRSGRGGRAHAAARGEHAGPRAGGAERRRRPGEPHCSGRTGRGRGGRRAAPGRRPRQQSRTHWVRARTTAGRRCHRE
jgi:hypothetical protein